MNIKKIISILLVLTLSVTLLAACGGEEKKAKEEHSINPELISAFGEEMIKSEEENIADLVGGLEDCYKQYQKDNDLDAFVVSVDDAMSGYKGYLEEISAELINLYEDAKAEGNKERMMELLSTHSSSIAYVADESTWSMYKMCLDNNMEIWQDKQDVEESVLNYINDISEFFYCEPIAD